MKNPMHLPSVLAAVLSLSAPAAMAAVTTNLVAYWNFEGQSDNNTAASGGSAFNGVLTGGATTTGTPRAGTGALGLDGINDYMDVTSNVPSNAAWSISAWFMSDVVPASPARYAVYESTDNSASGGNAFAMSFGLRDGTTGNPAGLATQTSFEVFTRRNGSNASAQALVDDTAVAGIWHHTLSAFTPATATETGSIVTYLDGIAVSTITLAAGAVLEPFAGLHIGTFRAASGRWFDGSIDEVALWDRTLTPAEATEVYTLGNNSLPIPEPSSVLLAGLITVPLLRRRR